MIDISAYETRLEITAWDKPTVAVEAELIFRGKPNKDVEEFYENFEQNVEALIIKTAGRLEINTRLDDPDKVNVGIGPVSFIQVGFSEKELSISYRISVPGQNDLQLKNKYEDTEFIGEFSGDVSIDYYSGEISIEKITGNCEFDMKYGTTRIGMLKNAMGKIYEQDLSIQEATKLDLSAKYSDVQLKACGRLEILDYEGKWETGDIQYMVGEMKYADLRSTGQIDDLTLELYETDLDCKDVNHLVLKESRYGEYAFQNVGEFIALKSYEDELNLRKVDILDFDGKYGEISISHLTNSAIIQGYENDIEINRLDDNFREIRLNGKYGKLNLMDGSVPYRLEADLTYGNIDVDENKMIRKIYIKESNKLKMTLVPKVAPEKADLPKIVVNGYECKIRLN
jgi:hypothetical protein